MKKLLFALVAFLSLSISIAAQVTDTKSGVILLDERKKDSQEVDPQKGTRSVTLQSVSAYLYNNMVSIYFNQDFPTVTVTVICEATGEVVHDESYNNPATLSIDLATAPNGAYYIVIETEVSFWEGSFSL